MATEVEFQFFDVVPLRKSQGFQLVLDTNTRTYDLWGLSWGGKILDKAKQDQYVYIRLHAQGADLFYRFQDVNDTTMAPATTIAAGGTIAFQAEVAERLPQNASIDLRINIKDDRYFSVQGSAAGIVRVSCVSPPNA